MALCACRGQYELSSTVTNFLKKKRQMDGEEINPEAQAKADRGPSWFQLAVCLKNG